MNDMASNASNASFKDILLGNNIEVASLGLNNLKS